MRCALRQTPGTAAVHPGSAPAQSCMRPAAVASMVWRETLAWRPPYNLVCALRKIFCDGQPETLLRGCLRFMFLRGGRSGRRD